MKRFASLDFLRGFAIFMMVILHMVAHYIDMDAIFSSVNQIPIANILVLIILQFLGSLAGLFLLVSSISNMISMQKYLEKGKSVKGLAIKQILGGFILWIFAMISEALIGYNGSLGHFFNHLDTLQWEWDTAATRWGTFEAIHTIAVCVIINGAIQALLSLNEGWRDPQKQMVVYVIIAFVVIFATKYIWEFFAKIFVDPNGVGFPWGRNPDGSIMFEPDIRTSGFGIILRGMFIGALAAPMEPIFPYLAVSCFGSIIGIAISQPKKALFKGFVKYVLLFGLILFFIGLGGVIYESVNVLNALGFEQFAEFYQKLSYHRHWFPDVIGNYPNRKAWADIISSWAWLYQFFAATGFSIMWTMIMIFLIDFRGKGKKFAQKTKFIRRFGFIAFTNYTMQWLYSFQPYYVPFLFGLPMKSRLGWGGTILSIFISLSLYHLILTQWEKINYRGSMEWMMAMIGSYLIPARKPEKELKWYERGDLPVRFGFYDVEWVSVFDVGDTFHNNKGDSKLVHKLSIASFAIPLFIPFSIVLYPIVRNVINEEGKNKKNKIALRLSMTGTILTIIFLIFIGTVSFSMLGVNL